MKCDTQQNHIHKVPILKIIAYPQQYTSPKRSITVLTNLKNILFLHTIKPKEVNMKKHVILLTLAIPLLGLSSCMSIFSSSQQPITITGENGIKLYDATNNVKLAEIKEGESTTIRLKKKLSDKTIIAKKEGYKNTPFVIESAFNAKSLWNILFWPGFLIDLGTGKINKYDPVIYNIEMEKE